MPHASEQISERAARAALSTYREPGTDAAGLAELGPVDLWRQLVDRDTSGRLAHYRPEDELATAQLTAQFVIPGDAAWPTALDALGDERPFGLWVRGSGNLAALSATAIVVTGGRAATTTGTRAAGELARNLATSGRTLAAPLSYGIDTAAHHGAHAEGAPTLAVLPCGLDTCHPGNQAELMIQVQHRGGVTVSAYRPGTPTSRDTLTATAKLLAALSSAVVLIEPAADIRTVPLEAAQAARKLRRPVFVVTGTDPEYSLPRNGQTEQLLRKVKAQRIDSTSDALTFLP